MPVAPIHLNKGHSLIAASDSIATQRRAVWLQKRLPRQPNNPTRQRRRALPILAAMAGGKSRKQIHGGLNLAKASNGSKVASKRVTLPGCAVGAAGPSPPTRPAPSSSAIWSSGRVRRIASPVSAITDRWNLQRPAFLQDEQVIAVAVLTGSGADLAAGSDPAVALPLNFGEIGEIQTHKSGDSLLRLGTLLKPLP